MPNILSFLLSIKQLKPTNFIRNTTDIDNTSHDTISELCNKCLSLSINGIYVDVSKNIKQRKARYSGFPFQHKERAILLSALSQLCFEYAHTTPNIVLFDELATILNNDNLFSIGNKTTSNLFPIIKKHTSDHTNLSQERHNNIHINCDTDKPNIMHVSFAQHVSFANDSSQPSTSTETQIRFMVEACPDNTINYSRIKFTMTLPKTINNHSFLSNWDIFKVNCRITIQNIVNKITSFFTRRTYTPEPKFKKTAFTQSMSTLEYSLQDFSVNTQRSQQEISRHICDFRQAFEKFKTEQITSQNKSQPCYESSLSSEIDAILSSNNPFLNLQTSSETNRTDTLESRVDPTNDGTTLHPKSDPETPDDPNNRECTGEDDIPFPSFTTFAELHNAFAPEPIVGGKEDTQGKSNSRSSSPQR
ncbi:hypothetical protein FDZ58_01320 [Ehrlichia ruminantium]|uniref:hypothetical protein n=1 Tax=Ehrlichia ruminantium TaxID=779 RepID=UPI0015DC3B57|nr:hypothetical protein [Ehrlichia ruminantium]QLK50315.1 hypothetical protein FDZ68_01320 [Ehrlichia ruminantium]QLK51239.1 hypothetical protein FDZ66_01325 [Ehrlichia ruminantium]QLK53074.1 hypothetical protein FDZ64_01320 [Ehrlichia ruminantium]QLK58576.1 hypothetical protein FDZ58_01320 [Ehrlichia ruminantium]